MNELLNNILSDLRIETLDEFDRNFTRKAFFNSPWPERRAPGGRGTLLAVTGRMRRSLRCRVSGSSLLFCSDTAYFSLHNLGGKVPVTPGMRRYFWAMYYRYGGGRKDKPPGPLAEYYRSLALTRKSEFTIPRRQAVGSHPKIDRLAEKTCSRNVREWIARNIDPKYQNFNR